MNKLVNKTIALNFTLLIFFILTLATNAASAADLQWSGSYRAEGNYLKNFTFDNGAGKEASYMTNHLILSPKIVAMDGLNIYSRFDLLNNAIQNNYSGQPLGTYTGNFTSTSGQSYPPAVTTNSQGSNQTFNVTELYMNWVNEFGALVFGRVPFGFGLGMRYSKGEGMFDHYVTTKDMVGYRLAIGNFTLMPAYGKVKEGNLLNEDDINDYIVMAEYKNPESDVEFGVLYDQRIGPVDASSPVNGNDIPATYFDPTATIQAGYNVYNMNLFLKKKTENFDFGVEGGFQNGDTGARTSSGKMVDVAGFGVAAEATYRAGTLTYNLHAGMATGDNPDTTRFEGYFFSPNYNLAMMMFHHPMGQYDAMRSALAGSRPWQYSSDPAVQALQGLDTETVSNAIYLSPKVSWAMGERYDATATFCYAITQQNPLSAALGTVGNSLGFEMDYGFRYHMGDKFVWETTVGLWFPGSAWAGSPSSNYATSLAYGATSKAAINF